MTTTAEAPEPSMIESWSIDKIVPADDNVRSQVGDIEGLAESIKELGILEPLLVCLIPGTDQAMIMAGERRHAAAQLAGLTHVEVIVTESIDNDKRFTTMLVENLQREGLSALDLARGFKVLADSGMSQRDIAKKVGVSQSMVSKHLSLLKLPEVAQEWVNKGLVSQEDGVRFAALDEAAQAQLVDQDDPTELSEDIDRIELSQKSEKLAQAVVAKFVEEGIDAYLAAQGAKPEGIRRGSRPAYQMHWVRDHSKKTDCRAVVVRPSNWGDPRVEEWCTDPKKHPDPRAKAKPTKAASKQAAEDTEILAILTEALAVAGARRMEFITSCPVPSDRMVVFAEVVRAMGLDYAWFDPKALEAVGLFRADAVDAWVNSEDRFLALMWRNVLFQLEDDTDLNLGQWNGPKTPADFVLDGESQRGGGDHRYLKLLESVGYEPSWIESKRIGLPYEEPQVPGTSSPATEEGASGAETAPVSLAGDLPAETPAITITAKRGKHYLRCSGCPWTGVNTKIEMAEENRRVHLKETHGIGAVA